MPESELTSGLSLAHRLIPRSAFIGKRPSLGAHFDKLVVGVAIVHPTAAPLQLLLVHRAAHEQVLPNHYEFPGGHVEESDSTILHAAAREVLEETGLTVNKIVGEIAPLQYSILTAEDAGSTTTIHNSLQLNFVAKVASIGPTKEPKVVLNPDEHQGYVWVSKGDVDRYYMTEGMKKIVMDAFYWGENNLGQVSGEE